MIGGCKSVLPGVKVRSPASSAGMPSQSTSGWCGAWHQGITNCPY